MPSRLFLGIGFTRKDLEGNSYRDVQLTVTCAGFTSESLPGRWVAVNGGENDKWGFQSVDHGDVPYEDEFDIGLCQRHLAEVQIHHTKLIEVKKTVAHKDYTDWRTIMGR